MTYELLRRNDNPARDEDRRFLLLADLPLGEARQFLNAWILGGLLAEDESELMQMCIFRRERTFDLRNLGGEE